MKQTSHITINFDVEEETFAKILALAGDETEIGDYLAQLVGEAYAARQDPAATLAEFDEQLEAKLATLG